MNIFKSIEYNISRRAFKRRLKAHDKNFLKFSSKKRKLFKSIEYNILRRQLREDLKHMIKTF